MIKRQWRIERIVAVQREYCVALAAVGLLESELRQNPSFGEGAGWSMADARALGDNLEATYLIRLYAEFEVGLRDYWRNYLKRESLPWVNARHSVRGRRCPNPLWHRRPGTPLAEA